MTARTAYLLSHSKSRNYWFRRAIPQGWRHFAEKREISFSLRTTNKKEAQRRCRLAAGLVQVFFDEVEQLITVSQVESWLLAEQVQELLSAKLKLIKQALQASSLANIARLKELMHSSTLKHLAAETKRPDEFLLEESAQELQVTRQTLLVNNGLPSTALQSDVQSEAVVEPNRWADYLRYWKLQRDPTLKTYNETTKVIERWQAFSKNKPLALITVFDINGWIANLKTVPLQSASIKRYISLIRAVINVAIKGQLILHKQNPFQDVSIPVVKRADGQEKRLPFTETQLHLLFQSPIFKKGRTSFPAKGGGEASFWIPLILLTTGARLEEIGQLYLEDIICRQNESTKVL